MTAEAKFKVTFFLKKEVKVEQTSTDSTTNTTDVSTNSTDSDAIVAIDSSLYLFDNPLHVRKCTNLSVKKLSSASLTYQLEKVVNLETGKYAHLQVTIPDVLKPVMTYNPISSRIT